MVESPSSSIGEKVHREHVGLQRVKLPNRTEVARRNARDLTNDGPSVLVVQPCAAPYNFENMSNVIMIALGLLTYGNPPFLGWIWFRRLTRDGKETKWRAVSLGAAMSLATAAELVLWTAVWFLQSLFRKRGLVSAFERTTTPVPVLRSKPMNDLNPPAPPLCQMIS